jgi:iron complex transport system ATP-binding protein
MNNASFGYGKEVVLNKVSMDIKSGSMNCVFGRNGSGKTTLLKSLAGLIGILDGAVKLDGRNAQSLSNHDRSRLISVVLTSRPLISNITVESYVSFGRYPYSNFLNTQNSEDAEIIQGAIMDSGISDLRNKWLSELSDGEMQKVQIARALVQNTRILLLDEPASHLDLVNKGEIFNLLNQIASEGKKTVLFTSHDIQFSLQLADNFIVVNGGKVAKMNAKEFKERKIYNDILKSDYVDIDPAANAIKYKKINPSSF